MLSLYAAVIYDINIHTLYYVISRLQLVLLLRSESELCVKWLVIIPCNCLQREREMDSEWERRDLYIQSEYIYTMTVFHVLFWL